MKRELTFKKGTFLLSLKGKIVPCHIFNSIALDAPFNMFRKIILDRKLSEGETFTREISELLGF